MSLGDFALRSQDTIIKKNRIKDGNETTRHNAGTHGTYTELKDTEGAKGTED